MRIVDTHLHLIYRDRFTYPWLAGSPKLNRDWTLADYRREAAAAGIEAMLHMEVDVVEADIERETAFATRLDPQIIGAIAACRPEHKDFPALLDRLAANPKVRGLRRILHQAPDDLSQTPLFAANLRRLSGRGLSFDFCVLPHQIPFAARLAGENPEVQFVLDHCGNPDIANRLQEPWRANIAAIAELPNVACKLSGIVAYAGPDWSVNDLRPYAEHVIESFGWDRVVWGSDWPVCTLHADLTRWVAATHDLIAGASENDKVKLLRRNAERIYRTAG